jgi:hypothetical protein
MPGQIKDGGPMQNHQNTSTWYRSDAYNIRNINRALLSLPITLASIIYPQQTSNTSSRPSIFRIATSRNVTLSGPKSAENDVQWLQGLQATHAGAEKIL